MASLIVETPLVDLPSVGPTSNTRTEEVAEENLLYCEAIAKAKQAVAQLRDGEKEFQECVRDGDTILDVLQRVRHAHESFQKQKSTILFEKFERYTTWLQNMAGVVDVVVQTQAGIGCPVWAPLKLVLKISNDHHKSAQHILRIFETLTEKFPRFEIYRDLEQHSLIQTSLLRVFTDIVEFAVVACRYYRRKAFKRIFRQLRSSFQDEFEEPIGRLERHCTEAHNAASAVELHRQSEFRKSMRMKEERTTQIQCKQWLNPPKDQAAYDYALRSRLTGTCQWIWNHESFKNWHSTAHSTPEERLLTIHGIPGCGKSVLATTIASAFRDQGIYCLFFQFSGTDESRQTSEDLIRSFLWQLLVLVQKAECFDRVLTLASKGEPLEKELWSILIDIATGMTLYFIVDGIDESATAPEVLRGSIVETLRAVSGVRAAMLGRIHAFSADVLPTSPSIAMSPAITTEDISLYITSRISEYPLLSSSELKNEVFTILNAKADGMFLWVKLIVDHLGRSSNKAQVKQRLKDLPRGLGKIYMMMVARLVNQLDTYERRFVQTVLRLICITARPLTIDEVRIADSLMSGSPETYQERLEENVERRLINLSCGLILVEDGHLQPVHLSLKEFLTGEDDEWYDVKDSLIQSFRVEPQNLHRALVKTGVEYLQRLDYGSPLDDDNSFLNLGITHQFLEYISSYGAFHLNRCGAFDEDMVKTLQQGINSNGFDSWAQYFSMVLMKDVQNRPVYSEILKFERLLEIDQGLRLLDQRKVEATVQQIFSRTSKYNLDLESSSTSIRDEVEQMCCFTRVDDLYSDDARDNLAAAIDHSSSPLKAPTRSHTASLIKYSKAASTSLLPRQVNTYIALKTLFRSAKSVSDSLKIFFECLLRHATRIPIPILLLQVDFYERLDKFKEAEQVLEAIFSRLSGQDSELEYMVKSRIGNNKLNQQKYKEAENIFTSVLLARQMLFGDDDPQVWDDAKSLSYCLEIQEKFEEAEPIWKRTLYTQQKVLGDHNPKVWDTAYFYAYNLNKQRKFEEAEPIWKRTLYTQQKVLGDHNPKVWDTAYFYAYNLDKQRKFEEAEYIWKRTLYTQQKVLGDHNPKVWDTAYFYAYNLDKQRKFEEAEPIWKRTLYTQQKVLGDHNPKVWDTAYFYAYNLNMQKKFEEAEHIWKRILIAQQNILGDNDPELCRVANQYILNLILQWKLDEAEAFCRANLPIFNEQLGSTNEFSMRILHRLRISRAFKAKVEEKVVVVSNQLSNSERVLGQDHPLTLTRGSILAHLYHIQSRYREAGDLFRSILQKERRILGDTHSETIATSLRFCDTLKKLQQFEEAESLCEETLVNAEKALGENHTLTLHAKACWSDVLLRRKDFKEAEIILRSNLRAQVRHHGYHYPSTSETLDQLATIPTVDSDEIANLRLKFKEYRQGIGDESELLSKIGSSE